ncbi:MAG: hypothetical protein DRG30_06330 [Epsilonproteobacteria bacterium]|nr:MAG: hypothetical protein DRG30_06330 [Campylobacterota bacterium]
MNSIFGEVISNEFTGLQVKRGGTYGGKKFGKNSPDSTYIDAGLYPIMGDTPSYDSSIERLNTPVYAVEFEHITRTYAVIPLTQEALLEMVERLVQKMLDDTAIQSGYDSIMSACTYATSTGSFGVEGQKFVNWRDAVWTHLNVLQSDIASGATVAPTLEELMAGLPAYPAT